MKLIFQHIEEFELGSEREAFTIAHKILAREVAKLPPEKHVKATVNIRTEANDTHQTLTVSIYQPWQIDWTSLIVRTIFCSLAYWLLHFIMHF